MTIGWPGLGSFVFRTKLQTYYLVLSVAVIAYLLICRVGVFDLRATPDVVALGLGMLLSGLGLARLFGRFHGGNSPGAYVQR